MDVISSEKRVVTLPKNNRICFDDSCSLEVRPLVHTTHKQTGQHLEIIIGFGGPATDVPHLDLIVEGAMRNLTQLTHNRWHSLVDMPHDGCVEYHLIAWRGGSKYRYPQNGSYRTYGVGCCLKTREEASEEGHSVYFSILLYIVLIACCLYV